MLWSNWKVALMAAILFGGLAYSQIPNSQNGAKHDRIMTVHEDGKAIRCRVIKSWQESNGSTAYQLQALDTGEMMTIVQDGQAGNLQGVGPGEKTRAVPMRIFHWGRNKTSPAGAPVPTDVIQSSGQVVSSKTVPGTERVIMWDQNNGQSVHSSTPVVVGNSEPVVSTGHFGQPSVVNDNRPCPTPGCVDSKPRVIASGSVQNQVTMPWSPRPVVKNQPTNPEVIQTVGNPPAQVLWEKYTDPITGKEVYSVPPKEVQSQPQTTQKPTQPRRFGGLFGPKQPAEVVNNPTIEPKNQPTFSTAAPGTPPNSTKPTVAPLHIGDAGPKELPVANADPKKDIPAKDLVKNDRPWRDMWGQAANPKAQQPGQSLVEPPPTIKLPPSYVPDAKKEDILLNPSRLNTKENQDKSPMLPPAVPAAQAGQTYSPPTVNVANPQIPGSWPLGSQSVLAAKNGNMNGTTFVPVPIATVPNPAKLPAPPEPKLPDPPAPNAWVNAFTPPPKQQQDQQAMQNAAFQQMSGQQPAPIANPFMMAQGMPGYGLAPVQQAGYGQRPGLNYMANYKGPAAPNPFGQQAQVSQQPQQTLVPTTYQQPVAVLQQGGFPVYLNPAVFQQTPVAAQLNEAVYLNQLVGVLRESPYPAQREWAATTLATYDWRAHPQIIQVLIGSARQDPAPTVRAGCVYSLARMNAQLEPVTTTFQTLRQDADPRVRQEAEQGLSRFGVKQ